MASVARSTLIRSHSSSFIVLAVFGLFSIGLVSCTLFKRQDIEATDSYSSAVLAFQSKMPAILEQMLEETIETDSLLLIESRKGLRKREKLEALTFSSDYIRGQVEVVALLKNHADLIRIYFVSLQALLTTEGRFDVVRTGTHQAAKALSNSTAAYSLGLLVGEDIVEDSKIVVEANSLEFQGLATPLLRAELSENGPIVSDALNIQASALRYLARSQAKAVEGQANAAYRETVVSPYLSEESLPNDWAKRRLDVLRRRLLGNNTVSEAANIASALDRYFRVLLKGAFGKELGDVLREDIANLDEPEAVGRD